MLLKLVKEHPTETEVADLRLWLIPSALADHPVIRSNHMACNPSGLGAVATLYILLHSCFVMPCRTPLITRRELFSLRRSISCTLGTIQAALSEKRPIMCTDKPHDPFSKSSLSPFSSLLSVMQLDVRFSSLQNCPHDPSVCVSCLAL